MEIHNWIMEIHIESWISVIELLISIIMTYLWISIIESWIPIYALHTTGASVLDRPFCARRMGPSGFHTLSDITWSIVYNAVPEIRLAGSVSVEWFLAINF